MIKHLPKTRPFLKMHGAGNDFIIIDSRGMSEQMTETLAQGLGDRHRGVGFDQLAEITTGPDGAPYLSFWNSDGSRSGTCGNATRCVAHLLMEEAGTEELVLHTDGRKLQAARDEGQVWVNMGAPILENAAIPLAPGADPMALPLDGAPVAVGMGNPHAVHFVADAEAVALTSLGPQVEHDPLFPARTNVEFAQVLNRSEIRLRVWERGTGVTLACGSGACATAVAAVKKGLTDPFVALHMDGGTLQAYWRDDDIWLTGPVATVFKAELDPSFYESLA
ncbi:MAG: diaminopimelate epimerase [Mangrovicoccus sp.]